MLVRGTVYTFGNDINTDVIYPGKYLSITTDREEMARHCFEAVYPEFREQARKGDIIVAGKNFGLGSSREHAPLIIKMAGVSAILAKSVARIFFRNAINLGLPVLICDTDIINDGDELEVDLAAGVVSDITSGKEITFGKIPEVMLRILEEGGLVPFIQKYGNLELPEG